MSSVIVDQPSSASEYSFPSVSTPTLPGSYPPDATTALEHLFEAANNTGGFDLSQHVESVKSYFPSGQQVQQTVGNVAETASQYVPSKEDVQRTIGNVGQAVKHYIPQPVVDTVTNVLPSSLTESDTSEDLDHSAASFTNVIGASTGTAVAGVATTGSLLNDYRPPSTPPGLPSPSHLPPPGSQPTDKEPKKGKKEEKISSIDFTRRDSSVTSTTTSDKSQVALTSETSKSTGSDLGSKFFEANDDDDEEAPTPPSTANIDFTRLADDNDHRIGNQNDKVHTTPPSRHVHVRSDKGLSAVDTGVAPQEAKGALSGAGSGPAPGPTDHPSDSSLMDNGSDDDDLENDNDTGERKKRGPARIFKKMRDKLHKH